MPFSTRQIGRPTGAAAFALALGMGGVCPADVTAPNAVLSKVVPPARAGLLPGPVPAPVPTGTTGCCLTTEPALGAGVPEGATRVALGPGGRDLRLAGDLNDGVAARVAVLLATNPQVERIHLTSDGGLVAEASMLGALVAARGLATYVPDVCASACTLVFARGRRRYLAVGAKLGFHAPYVVGPHGRMRAVDAAPERSAYLAAGLPPDFVARVMAVPPAGIWTPDVARLRRAGAVTEVVGRDRFPDSTLDADPSLRGARAAILRGLPILRLVDAAGVDAAAGWYRDGYGAGRTEAEATAGLRAFASASLQRRFRTADDAVVRALGRGFLAAMRGAKARGGAGCGAVASGDPAALDAALHAAGRSSPGLAPLIARTPGGTDPGSPASRPRIPATVAPADGPEGCGARIAAVKHALGLPAREAAAQVRSLFLSNPPLAMANDAGP